MDVIGAAAATILAQSLSGVGCLIYSFRKYPQLRVRKEDFKINILSIDEKDPVKNIFFEITDNKLLNKTNGIVQGMSGSPIIQNNKIIGVVNYVVLNDTKKGYGIFIETMLKEGDKLN